MRRPLSSQEIGANLDIPRSSTAALLRALVDLGILSIDRRQAQYFPTAQFARLGSWLDAALHSDDRVLAITRRLQEETRETITIAVVADTHFELTHVERSQQAISFVAEAGQRFRIFGTAIGVAYLMTLSDREILALHERLQRRADPQWSPEPGSIPPMQRIHAARSIGYSAAYGAVFEGAGAISLPLPASAGPRPMVLSVAGPSDRLRSRESDIARLCKREIAGLADPL